MEEDEGIRCDFQPIGLLPPLVDNIEWHKPRWLEYASSSDSEDDVVKVQPQPPAKSVTNFRFVSRSGHPIPFGSTVYVRRDKTNITRRGHRVVRPVYINFKCNQGRHVRAAKLYVDGEVHRLKCKYVHANGVVRLDINSIEPWSFDPDATLSLIVEVAEQKYPLKLGFYKHKKITPEDPPRELLLL